MKNSEIKIIVSETDGTFARDIKTKLIEGLDSMKFSNNIGGGQGEIDLRIKTNYDDMTLSQGQLVEIAFYNSEFPSGSVRFCGFVKNVNRQYDQEDSDSVDLEILGIGSILGEYEGTFTASGPLNSVVTAFIAQFHAIYNIAVPMEFLGSSLFKNGIIDTAPVTMNKTGTYFEILKEIFNSITPVPKTFFISKDGTIYLGDQSTIEHLFTLNKDIINMRLSSSRETEIVLVGNDYNIEPGDKIYILNVNANFNLDGERIQKVEIGMLDTRIYLGNIWSLGTDIETK